ncbi:sigma factor-like helix-turn-helix DNA-binding protein [Clostridium sp. MB40-C1]|uniref:sigma factor-like helix-turn-helix DNA-binding protein n=1 Tax=Clostridium sp. MB40-C1 TaxID=3070996 RepID=UPI0027DFD225|nr:sigma factor-like helix-turn-helix DNA-binding protein [Clostridium sp. MB40-C1]WMJ79553.1 sigma factor-like helix-turn-helix DNA-binding protein [Clostridium sp. MB40-C1]
MNLYKKVEYLLYNYKNLKAEIKNIELEIESIANDYNSSLAISYEEKSAPTNKISSSVENKVVSKEEKIKYLQDIKRNKEIQVQKIDNALESLAERDKKVIELRYFEKISNKKLAERLDLTEQRVSEIKSIIVNNLIKLIFV